jgi:small multidrug resistance pump/quaternary ammonium compound-resistance protein SugE
MNLLLSVTAAVTFAFGGVCMKYSEGLTRPAPTVLLFILFCAGAAAQTLAMRHAEMGATYILVLGLESALAFTLGVLVFREPATPVRILAVLLVTAGIVLLRR